MKKQPMIFGAALVLFGMGFCGCLEDPDPGEELSLSLGGFLSRGVTDDHISEFIKAVDYFGKNDKKTSLLILDELLDDVDGILLDEVVVDSPLIESTYYQGLYLNDVRDCRCVLANVKNVKEDGFDTVWIEVQFMVYKNGTFYIPGEEVYLFYLNAFHASGFRVWLSMGHTSYSFPYRWDQEPTTSYPSLSSQKDVFYLAEPEILIWAELAKNME